MRFTRSKIAPVVLIILTAIIANAAMNMYGRFKEANRSTRRPRRQTRAPYSAVGIGKTFRLYPPRADNAAETGGAVGPVAITR